MKKLLVAVALLCLATPAFSQTAPAPAAIEKIHQDLRAMKDRLVAALNEKKPDAALAELDPQVRLTTMDAVLSKGLDGTKAYYDKMMTGASKFVDDMSIKVDPDELSLLYADNKIAVTTGTAQAHFRIVGGKELDVPVRWTSTSVNRDGKWKVATAQFSANMFDNPVLSASQFFATWLAVGAGIVGLLVGWLVGRRKRSA